MKMSLQDVLNTFSKTAQGGNAHLTQTNTEHEGVCYNQTIIFYPKQEQELKNCPCNVLLLRWVFYKFFCFY